MIEQPAMVLPLSTALVVGLLALLGVLVTQGVLIYSSVQSRRAEQRAELLRNIRWAAELAGDQEERKADLGLAALKSIQSENKLTTPDAEMIDAIVFSLVDEEIDEFSGDDIFELEGPDDVEEGDLGEDDQGGERIRDSRDGLRSRTLDEEEEA
ncbi:hypothetical protein GCM10027418_28470 [Mariniluteicoccus endophyticus]